MYDYQPPRKRREVPQFVKDKAISLLITNPTDSQKVSLSKFIDNKFGTLDCCVLYEKSEDFKKLCEKINIDIGKKEVVINAGFNLLYTPDYVLPPSAARV